jgi:hypothetical protein
MNGLHIFSPMPLRKAGEWDALGSDDAPIRGADSA